MNLRTLIHVAQIDLTPTSGMGRIAWEWRAAAQRGGIDFIHLGQEEIGPVRHRLLFPPKAREKAMTLAEEGTALLIHEPCAWAFRRVPWPVIAFSHGVEPRGFEIERHFEPTSPKRRITTPILRWLGLRGLRAMDLILVSNSDDRKYLLDRSIQPRERIRIFRNGVDASPTPGPDATTTSAPTVLFNGSWLERKGIATLIQAAALLAEKGIRPRWLLIGTVASEQEVLARWPEVLRPEVSVIPSFQREEEAALLARAEIFVLPSFFEGQSLALAQALAAGRCCIASNCCGQRDLIQHGQNGLLFTPGNGTELAGLIQRALDDRNLREELGRNARITARELAWASVADDVIAMIRQACDSISKPSSR
jgi:glycosyltransferase involved in cell wall biosynthesis